MEKDLLLAIGDLHGCFHALEAILDRAGGMYGFFSDTEKKVLRPGAQLVTLGDYIDHGHEGLRIISRLRELQERNPGSVVALPGNHELMAIFHRNKAETWLRIYQEDLMSEAELYLKYSRTEHGQNGGMTFLKEFGESLSTAHQMARFVHELSDQGEIGKWILSLPPTYVTRFWGWRILFSHADIPGHWSPDDLRNFEERYARAAAKPDREREDLIRGPLIHVRYAWDSDYSIAETLRRLKFHYHVVGHTGCDSVEMKDRAVMTDNRMGRPKSDPGAAVFKPDGIYAMYAHSGYEYRMEPFGKMDALESRISPLP